MYENLALVIKAICFVGIFAVISAVANFGAISTNANSK